MAKKAAVCCGTVRTVPVVRSPDSIVRCAFGIGLEELVRRIADNKDGEYNDLFVYNDKEAGETA